MKTISASATVTINALAKALKKSGKTVYNFAAGDPVLVNHPHIINRVVKEVSKGSCPYPPVEGLTELRHLCAAWMNATCHTDYSKENVIVTSGGKFALFAVLQTLIGPGDEVLIPAPYWVSYPDIAHLLGASAKCMPSSQENGWKITGKDLLHHATERSKILIFNNATNPTGILYTKEEVRGILEAAKQLGLLVVSDEVYSGLTFEDASFISCGCFSAHQEHVLIIQSCSKNFGMTGWRVGFILGPENILKRIAALQGQIITGTPLASQWAAIGALENASEVNTYVRQAMQQRRDVFIETYNTLFPLPLVKPQAAIYAFAPLSSMGVDPHLGSAAFCELLIKREHIALVPGIAFGVEGYVRFAFSDEPEDIKKALSMLHYALKRREGEK